MLHSFEWVDYILLIRKVFKMKYNFSNIQPITNAEYNNTEAHNELKAIMNRNERINISFGIDNDGYEIVYA